MRDRGGEWRAHELPRDNEAVFDGTMHRLLRDTVATAHRAVMAARRTVDGLPLFSWFVANDSIDPYLTYRLIEPI
jgi:predicted alpha-1,6-mannanase (GH76 family)